MESKLFFKGTCPKCDTYDNFKILHSSSDNASKYAESFVFDEWREYNYELFSIVSLCDSCKHYVCGNVAAAWNEVKNAKASLSDFASEDGEIVQNEDLFIEFDVPPQIPQQHLSSPPVADMHYLYEEANRCYKIHAWDAVVILCRKVVDIQSAKMWREKFTGTRVEGNLYKRVYKLLADDIDFKNDIPIDEQLDHSNQDHALLYDIEQIRFWGNFAAHSEICVHSDDAEGAIIYTKSFIDAYYEWSTNLAKSKEDITS